MEAGKPVRLRFDRQEISDCSARVVSPDLRKSATLAAFGTTTLDLEITEPGEYSWVYGLNMLHGVIAEAPTSGQAPTNAADAGRERAEYALPGALRNLPTDVARAEAEQRALPKMV